MCADARRFRRTPSLRSRGCIRKKMRTTEGRIAKTSLTKPTVKEWLTPKGRPAVDLQSQARQATGESSWTLVHSFCTKHLFYSSSSSSSTTITPAPFSSRKHDDKTHTRTKKREKALLGGAHPDEGQGGVVAKGNHHASQRRAMHGVRTQATVEVPLL